MNFTKLRAILQGWKNVAFESEAIEKIARNRAKICAACPNANPEYPFKQWFPEENRIEEIKGLGCNVCGCPLSSKIRQLLETCPENRWKTPKQDI